MFYLFLRMSNNFAPPFTQAAAMIFESTGENVAQMNWPSFVVVSNTGTDQWQSNKKTIK